MVVDDCSSATINENEYDGTFEEDRAPCETERTTPGENRFINVNTPLQLGGRSNPNIAFPSNVMEQGFDGCVKNLVHDGLVSRASSRDRFSSDHLLGLTEHPPCERKVLSLSEMVASHTA